MAATNRTSTRPLEEDKQLEQKPDTAPVPEAVLEQDPSKPKETAETKPDEGTVKVKVKTTGAFMLQDPFSGEEITEEAKEVPFTPFISDRLDTEELEKA